MYPGLAHLWFVTIHPFDDAKPIFPLQTVKVITSFDLSGNYGSHHFLACTLPDAHCSETDCTCRADS